MITRLLTLLAIFALLSAAENQNVFAQAQTFHAGGVMLDDGSGHSVLLSPPSTGSGATITFPPAGLVWPSANASGQLTNDGSGNLSWATGSGGGWGLTGNSGTTVGTDFIGTTDAVDLEFKVNNIKSGYIGENANGLTAFGYGAMASTSGINNTGFGWQALGGNTTGTQNTAVGYSAMDNSAANDNTAVGFAALNNSHANGNTGVGSSALNSTSLGSNNTGIGYHALVTNSSGSNLAAIGANADVGSNALTDATALGANAVVSTSHTVQLGSSTVTTVNTSGTINCNGLNAAMGTITTNGAIGGATVSVGAHITTTRDFASVSVNTITVSDTPVFLIQGTSTANISITMPASPATGDVIAVINQCSDPATYGTVATVPSHGSRTFYFDGTSWQ